MEPQGQDYTTWDTRDRRATVFPTRQGGWDVGTPLTPARKGKTSVTYQEVWYRPCLARRKAICDFQVRWPEVILQEERKKEEGLSGTGHSAPDKWTHVASTCSSGVSLEDLESSPSEPLDSKGGFAGGRPPCLSEAPRMTILNSFLKPESMTRLQRKVRKKTLAAMSELEREMEAVKSRQSVLLRDVREMQKHIALEEAANKPFLEHLKKAGEERQSKYNSLWKNYIQQCQEIEVKRQELLSSFTSHTATLGKQLAQGRRLEAALRRKLRALRPVAQMRKRQDREKAALEREEASIVDDTPLMDRDRHWHFLKERAALEKRVEELNLLESGEDITRELRRTAKALEAAAKQAHKDFCQGINAESRRLRTQLHQLDEEFCQLEARREKLEQRKQQGKEQQWYLEALARGRQRLLQREHGCPKPQAAPHPTQGQPECQAQSQS